MSLSSYCPEPQPPGRVLVAMSGGVDSAVAAALLLERGWDVSGVTFKLFCYGDQAGAVRACCGLEGVRDAQGTARRLGISHTVLDLADLFRGAVLDDFAAEYARGRTPNPCVQCNTHIKFGPLLTWARRMGYEWIATGHYARRGRLEGIPQGPVLLRRAADPRKDQAYVLWGVPAPVLEKTLLPLGGLTKEQVRHRARDQELPLWDKEESQDICFVDERGYAAAVRDQLGPDHPMFRPGPILDEAGCQVGEHSGLVHYTVGQRRGLGGGGTAPRHVVRLDTDTNTLHVGPEEALSCGGLWADDLNVHAPAAWLEEGPVEVQIRYRHDAVPALARLEGDRLHVRFVEPQRAVAPGQSCVVYRDGWLLCGGRIRAACTCCPTAIASPAPSLAG